MASKKSADQTAKSEKTAAKKVALDKWNSHHKLVVKAEKELQQLQEAEGVIVREIYDLQGSEPFMFQGRPYTAVRRFATLRDEKGEPVKDEKGRNKRDDNPETSTYYLRGGGTEELEVIG